MSEHLELTVDQGLATIRFNRPDAMNAFTLRMIADLTDMVRDLAEDADCRVVVLRHAGANLCAGADAAELADSAGQTPSERGRAFYHGLATRIQPLLRAFRALPQPILVGAGGHAIGLGVQFLLVADLIVASETLKISLPQIRLGHVFDHGESFFLPRQIGSRKAMELALLGERMNAVDAERFGLVNFLVTEAELEARTDEVANKLLRMPPLALSLSKALMRNSETADLEGQLQTERLHASACAGTEDFVEAVAALKEKREPRFSGR